MQNEKNDLVAAKEKLTQQLAQVESTNQAIQMELGNTATMLEVIREEGRQG